MSDGPAAKPQPVPTAVSGGFWAGTREGRLLLQRCGSCKVIRHYPRPVCNRCFSLDVEWVEASGSGTVHSWTVCHHAYHPAFKGEVPYVLLTVDLQEGVRQLGRFEAAEAGRLQLGLPVQLRFEPTENGYALPAFVMAEEAQGREEAPMTQTHG